VMADLSEEKDLPEEIRNYFLRCGVRHLLEADRREAAKERLLDQSVFETLYEHDKYLLLGYWLELKENVYEAYEMVFDEWKNAEDITGDLAEFLLAAGYFGTFTEDLCRSDLANCEKKVGADHPDTLNSLNRIGVFLHKKLDFEEAEQMIRRALSGREKMLGLDHPTTLSSVADLVHLLVRNRDSLSEAETVCRSAIKSSSQSENKVSQDLLRVYMELGSLLSFPGYKSELDEAERMHRFALQGFTRILGPEHPTTLHSKYKLAMTLSKKGDNKGAEELYLLVCDGRERILGLTHPDTISSITNFHAFLNRKKCASESAREECRLLSERALEACEKVHGVGHSLTDRLVESRERENS